MIAEPAQQSPKAKQVEPAFPISPRRASSKGSALKTAGFFEQQSSKVRQASKRGAKERKRANSLQTDEDSFAHPIEPEICKLHSGGDIDLLRRTYSKARKTIIDAKTASAFASKLAHICNIEVDKLEDPDEARTESAELAFHSEEGASTAAQRAFVKVAKAIGLGASETLQERRRKADLIALHFIAAKNMENLRQKLSADGLDEAMEQRLSNIFQDLLKLEVRDFKTVCVCMHKVFSTSNLQENLANLRELLEGQLNDLNKARKHMLRNSEQASLLEKIICEAAVLQNEVEYFRNFKRIYQETELPPEQLHASSSAVQDALDDASAESHHSAPLAAPVRSGKAIMDWAVKRISVMTKMRSSTTGLDADDISEPNADAGSESGLEDLGCEGLRENRSSKSPSSCQLRRQSTREPSETGGGSGEELSGEEDGKLWDDVDEALILVAEALDGLDGADQSKQPFAQHVHRQSPGREPEHLGQLHNHGDHEEGLQVHGQHQLQVGQLDRQISQQDNQQQYVGDEEWLASSASPETCEEVPASHRQKRPTTPAKKFWLPDVFRGVVRGSGLHFQGDAKAERSRKAERAEKAENAERWHSVGVTRPSAPASASPSQGQRLRLRRLVLEPVAESTVCALQRAAKRAEGHVALERVCAGRLQRGDAAFVERVPRLELQPVLGPRALAAEGALGVPVFGRPPPLRFPDPEVLEESPTGLPQPPKLPPGAGRSEGPGRRRQLLEVADAPLPSLRRLSGFHRRLGRVMNSSTST